MDTDVEIIQCFDKLLDNNAFMGFPVIRALWGSKALVYAALLNIPVSVMMYTYGIWLYARGSGEQQKFSLRKLINITNVSAVVVLILAMFKFKFSGPAQDTLNIIDSEPERLLEVPGIGAARVERIRNSWTDGSLKETVRIFPAWMKRPET